MADLYRALGDPTRRKILRLLKDKHMTQKDIVESFNISQPAVKKHLNILLEEGFINERKEGKYRIYYLNNQILQAASKEMFHYVGQLLDHQLENLKNFVEKGEMDSGENKGER